MAARNLLPACLSLALLTAPVAAWADKPDTAEARKEAAAEKKKKKRAAERKRRAAERKKRVEARRRAEEKRREAEEKRREAEEKRRAAAEKKQREAEARRRAEEKREAQKREAQKREAQRRETRKREAQKREAQRREAQKREAQARQRQREKEAARRQAEINRRAEARREQEEAARRRALEQEEREAARRAAEEKRRARARQEAEDEARRQLLAAQRVESARRAAELQREAEARQDAEERAARASRDALREAAERDAAEARRKAEAIAAAEDEAAARAARALAAEAARAAARDLSPPELPAPTPLDRPTAAPTDDGGTVSGRGYPMRREPPPVEPRPIPRPDDPSADGADDPGPPGARQPISRPDDGPAFGRRGEADGGADRPAIGRRTPETRPRPDGPRRGDRASPRDGRDRWDETVDRVAEEAGRPPPPRPVRNPWPDPRDERRRQRRPRRDDPRYGFAPGPDAAEPYPEATPPPLAAPDADLGADRDAPIGRGQRALTAGPEGGPTPGAPPPAPDITLGARPLPIATPEARPASDWFDGFTARGAYAGWAFFPVGDLPAGAGAFERYTAEGLDLYRVEAILDTRWARLQARYESNRGFSVGRDDALLDLLVGLRAVPGLEGLTFEYLDLDFVHGRAELVEADGAVIESTPLKVDWRAIDLSYPLHDHVALFGRRFDSAMPRNVYLQRAGSGGALPISEQLLEVDTTAWAVGLDLAKADDGEGLFGGLKGWLGVGPYDIRTVSGGAFLDGGWLTAGGVEAHIGWRQPLGAGFSVGVHDTLTVVGLDPNGLPTGMQRDLEAQGLTGDDLSLRFGTVEVLNGLHIDLTWSI